MMVVVVVVAEIELGGGRGAAPGLDPVGPDCGPDDPVAARLTGC